jgi:hypothetical protein
LPHVQGPGEFQCRRSFFENRLGPF